MEGGRKGVVVDRLVDIVVVFVVVGVVVDRLVACYCVLLLFVIVARLAVVVQAQIPITLRVSNAKPFYRSSASIFPPSSLSPISQSNSAPIVLSTLRKSHKPRHH